MVADINSVLPTGNYFEKASLLARLKQARQLAESTSFGIPGTIRWQQELDGYAGVAAISDEGSVFCMGNSGVFALDGRTGKILWSNERLRSGEFVIGADGIIYFADHYSKCVVALHGQTGSELWKYVSKGWAKSAPAIGADGTLYFGLDCDGIIALNGKTGEMVWKTYENSEKHFCFTAPAISADGTVYVGSMRYGGLLAIDCTTGKVLWEYGGARENYTPEHQVSAPAIGADGTLYVVLAQHRVGVLGVLALNGETGKVLWSFEIAAKNYYESLVSLDAPLSAPAIGADGTVYLGLPVLALDGQTGKTLWEFQTRGTRMTMGTEEDSYAAYGEAMFGNGVAIGEDGAVYVKSENGVVALDGRTGKVLWECRTAERVTDPVIGADGTLYVGTAKGLCAIWTASSGWAKSPWPMSRQNSRRTCMSKEAAANYATNVRVRLERDRLAAEAKRIQSDRERLLSEAGAAVVAENAKWLRQKDFSHARELYAQAAALGSKEAGEKLKNLPG